jgi:hypothetical protein
MDVETTQNVLYTECAECEDATATDATPRRRRLRDDWVDGDRSRLNS